MKNTKGLLLLVGAILVSCSIFYFISPKDQIDGRFFLAVFSLISPMTPLWPPMLTF